MNTRFAIYGTSGTNGTHDKPATNPDHPDSRKNLSFAVRIKASQNGGTLSVSHEASDSIYPTAKIAPINVLAPFARPIRASDEAYLDGGGI